MDILWGFSTVSLAQALAPIKALPLAVPHRALEPGQRLGDPWCLGWREPLQPMLWGGADPATVWPLRLLIRAFPQHGLGKACCKLVLVGHRVSHFRRSA
jgi:hypothetical protein